MKIKLKETQEQIELIKAMGSRDPAVSRPAIETFAAFIGPVVQKVLDQAGTNTMIYKTDKFNEDDEYSYPLDLYYDKRENHVQVWSQNMAGGLASSHVSGLQELKVATYRLDSAVDWLKKYARRSRLNVVAAALNRMAQEILIKQETNAWIVLLTALAEASSNGASHVIDSTAAGRFQLDDLNRLLTKIRRFNTSFANGTSVGMPYGLTDLFCSPEIVEDIRGFAYQPMNTIAVPNTDESTAVPLPDAVRERIFNAAGTRELYGVAITDLIELGISQKYNKLFKRVYGGSFTEASQEIVIGADLSQDAFIRPVAQNADSGDTVVAVPDNQYVDRSEKIGHYASLEEGRIVLQSKALVGIRIT